MSNIIRLLANTAALIIFLLIFYWVVLVKKKREFAKHQLVLICPKCGSIRLSPANIIGIFREEYKCDKCDYRSSFFPEIHISKIKEFREKLRKKPKSREQSKKSKNTE
ncbi:hypothetical protein D6745_04775 [Candidatus Woesearchaeota archaeon]|nr:MAG: hypothetical protein D6745_04775 [Candidatus Woesearchaeota archaeon]